MAETIVDKLKKVVKAQVKIQEALVKFTPVPAPPLLSKPESSSGKKL